MNKNESKKKNDHHPLPSTPPHHHHRGGEKSQTTKNKKKRNKSLELASEIIHYFNFVFLDPAELSDKANQATQTAFAKPEEEDNNTM